MGVDFSLGELRPRRLPVAKTMAGRPTARWDLLRSCRKVARGVPGILHRTDCCRLDEPFLKLQAQWADCQEARPMGAPKIMWLLGREARLDPILQGATLCIFRYVRKVWLASSVLGRKKMSWHLANWMVEPGRKLRGSSTIITPAEIGGNRSAPCSREFAG